MPFSRPRHLRSNFDSSTSKIKIIEYLIKGVPSAVNLKYLFR